MCRLIVSVPTAGVRRIRPPSSLPRRTGAAPCSLRAGFFAFFAFFICSRPHVLVAVGTARLCRSPLDNERPSSLPRAANVRTRGCVVSVSVHWTLRSLVALRYVGTQQTKKSPKRMGLSPVRCAPHRAGPSALRLCAAEGCPRLQCTAVHRAPQCSDASRALGQRTPHMAGAAVCCGAVQCAVARRGATPPQQSAVSRPRAAPDRGQRTAARVNAPAPRRARAAALWVCGAVALDLVVSLARPSTHIPAWERPPVRRVL